MNQKIRDAFLFLLKQGLWGKRIEPKSSFNMNKEEWSLIYQISLSQTVEGLVYEGVLLLPNEFYPPYEILLRWTAKIDSIERFNKKVRNSLSILADGFVKNNIAFLLLKGTGLAENYNKPLLRVSGDIDLYFPSIEDYNNANSLLQARGAVINKGDHHSVFYIFNNVEIEHHTKMIDVFNPFCQKYIKDLIQREINNKKTLIINGQQIFLPSYTLSQVQANAHILKHYMGFGIGLRQICDVARLCFVKEESFIGDELKSIYIKLGLERWMNAVHNLLVKDLGLEESKLPYPIEKDYDTYPIMNDIFNSGNFGFHEIRYRDRQSNLSERYYKRDNIYKRVLPHIIKSINLAPSEVFWYPMNKLYTKLTGN
jgi:hypothetical protein